MFSLILWRKSGSKRKGDVSWNMQSMYRFSPFTVSLMSNFFFEPFDLLSETHYFKEEKQIAMPNELAHFLRDCLFADFVSDLVGYFLRKNFFRIHLNQNQISLREDNPYENRIIIQNLCQTGSNAATFTYSLPYLFSDRDKYSKQPLNILRRSEKEG